MEAMRTHVGLSAVNPVPPSNAHEAIARVGAAVGDLSDSLIETGFDNTERQRLIERLLDDLSIISGANLAHEDEQRLEPCES